MKNKSGNIPSPVVLSQGLALHRSTDPVSMTYITSDLYETETQIYFLGISGGLLMSSSAIFRCLWMLASHENGE